MKKLILLIILLQLIACQKIDFDDIHVTPNTSIPLGKATISDSSLFAFADLNSVLSKTQDDVLLFSMSDHSVLADENTVSQLINIRSQVYQFSYNLPELPPAGVGEIDLPEDGLTTQFYFNVDQSESITKLVLANGKLEMKVAGNEQFSNLVGTMPQITRNGVPIKFKVGDVIQIDKNCVIAPIKKDGRDNVLELVLTGKIPIVTKLEGKVTLTADKIYSVDGWFGRKTIANVETTIELTDQSFKEFASQTKFVYFADPQIGLKIDNTYNIPIMVDLAEIEIDGRSVGLKNEYGMSKFLIEPYKVTNVSISNKSTISGTGISDALTKNFSKIKVAVSGIANPTKEDLGLPSYVAPTKNSLKVDESLNLDYDISIPFDMVIEEVKISQSVAIDLAELLSAENQYDELAIALSGKNELPMDLQLLPYVTSDNTENGTKTYLFKTPVVINGTNSNLKPTDNRFEPYKFFDQNRILRKIDNSAITKLIKAEKLFFDFVTSSVDAQNKKAVKIYSPSLVELNVMVGIKADMVL